MASILTNTSAMVALQNLRTINNSLVDTQNQIATGKKIATAKDNSLFLVCCPEEPHQEKECHHRGNEIGIGDLPRTAVVTTLDHLLPLDNDRRFVVRSHGPSVPVPRSAE